jgi:DNA invertase Pin-like site-specific DNA recombinase
MKCLTYARVSTDKQTERELSIPAQLQAVRHYATERNWQIVSEFTEPGASGRTVERPALRQLLAECRESHDEIDVVLVHKIDRLARNVADHVAIRAILKKNSIRLASVTENLEESTSGELVDHIMAAIAEFYSANFSDEVKKGMRQKLLKGEWPHKPPRGYITVRGGIDHELNLILGSSTPGGGIRAVCHRLVFLSRLG